VVDHLVNDRGLAFDRDSVPEPGKIVFVYRQARDTGYGRLVSGLGIRAKWELAQTAPPSDHAAFPRRAA
jgi:hypothetical protein